jgi:hypothetical protein
MVRVLDAADPYTFLFASLMVLVFGAGFLAVDTPIAKRLKAEYALARSRFSLKEAVQQGGSDLWRHKQ